MHRFAVLTSASTLFLIFVGGLVTSTGSGLAVPDWPLSYGQVFPPMVGGVFYEHGHRMVAATVGFLTMVLAIWVLSRERRHWVGWLAAGALFTVILQGVLGGLTVLFLLPTPVSVLHGCLAQTFFCLTVVLAVVTGRRWESMGLQAARRTEAPDGPLAVTAAALTGAVFLQLVLGAVMRHMGAGLAIPDFPLMFGRIVPPMGPPAVVVHLAHRAWAVVVVAVAARVAWLVLARHREEPLLVRPLVLLLCLVALQVTLGAVTIWTSRAVLPTTAHVACGAAVLATSLNLTLRAYRLAAAPALRGAFAS